MSQFLYPTGSVYVLANPIAKRVKIGMTGIGVNDVADRLKDINDMWLGRRVTCQVCGRRIVNVEGLVPLHPKYGQHCRGSNALPLEKSVDLAKSELEDLLRSINELRGSEKGSAARRAKTLTSRVQMYRNPLNLAGVWHVHVAFNTPGPYEVESLVHKKLADHLDTSAPFGEVFTCSASEAEAALETSMKELGVLASARRRTRLC